MKIIFFGSDYYSTIALNLLLEKEGPLEVCLIITGTKKATYPFDYESVSEIANRNNIPTISISSGKQLLDYRSQIVDTQADLGFIYSFGYLVPEAIFSIPKFNTLNLHPSLLPKYRGVSPLQKAILNGDDTTGVTIITVDESFDTGKIVTQSEAEIDPDDTTYTLAQTLVTLGIESLVEVVKNHPDGDFPMVEQTNDDSTYTKGIEPDDAFLDFKEPDEIIYRKIRAFYPKPIAWTYLATLVGHLNPEKQCPDKWNNLRVKIFAGEMTNESMRPTKLQIEGKSQMSFDEFARGYLK